MFNSNMDGNSPGKRKPLLKGRDTNPRLSMVDADKAQEYDNAKTSLQLEHVLGMTAYSNSALTCHPRTGMVAYPAGCVLVLLDSVKNKQVGTLHTPRKSITAVKFSPDGRYVLTGESGLQPAVRVWDVIRMIEVASLRGHSVGIASVAFSPRMREIIVVGDPQDMMISVWAWPSKIMRALNKFADEIYAMAVSEDSSFFVTVGNRHVKFYNLDTVRHHSSHIDNPCPVPLPTRCGILDCLKENCFCDVVCGRGCSSIYIFVIAVAGILCQVNRNRLLERWVNVNMSKACCIDADESNVFVGGSQGAIRIFHTLSLQIITTLPRPHSLGLDIAELTPSYVKECTGDETTIDEVTAAKYPGTRALTFDTAHNNLTVVYDDHSLYMWGKELGGEPHGRVTYFKRRYSSMYHRGCVWDVTTYPVATETDAEGGTVGGALPPGALISVSADGTLRAWDVSAKICQESVLRRNFLSADCLKIVYANKMENAKKPLVKTPTRHRSRDVSTTSFRRLGKQCFSVVAVCPDGIDIATGNRCGRLCIYDTNSMKLKITMLAHEGEVTALRYSNTDRYKVLASGSRDRMIHVMDASRGYQLLTTLDDHSSTITAINFTHIARCLMMVTSSLDMSVLVRAYLYSNRFAFKPVRAIVEKKSVVDFTIHPWSGLMALACQDRLVRVYSIMSSVENNSFRGCRNCGQLIKIQIDPSGQFLLTACSNKTINLLQFSTGAMLCTINGHSESITSILFSHNMKHIISSATDGCIYLWRLPQSVTYAVKREMAEMGRLTRSMVMSDRWKKSQLLEDAREINAEKVEPQCELAEKTVNPEVKRTPVEEKLLKENVDTCSSSDNNLARVAQKSGVLPMSKPNNCNAVESTSEAWMTACYERRRIFKLEAQSIQKILAMMRLVTDAMEKDLANTGWLIDPENPDEKALNISRQAHGFSGLNELGSTIMTGTNMVKMVVASQPPMNGQGEERVTSKLPEKLTSPGKEPGKAIVSVVGHLSMDSLCAKKRSVLSKGFPGKQEAHPQNSRIPIRNRSCSNNIVAKPRETLTIQLSSDSSVCGCVGTIAFFKELRGLHYSSAVHHIAAAVEKRQRMELPPSPLLFRSSLPPCNNAKGSADGRDVRKDDDTNDNNVVLKFNGDAPRKASYQQEAIEFRNEHLTVEEKTKLSDSAVGEEARRKREEERDLLKTFCNLSLAVSQGSGCDVSGNFGMWSAGNILKFAGSCAGSFGRGYENVGQVKSAEICCTFKLDALGSDARQRREAEQDAVVDTCIGLDMSIKALIGGEARKNSEQYVSGKKDENSVCKEEKKITPWSLLEATEAKGEASVCSEMELYSWGMNDTPKSKEVASVCSEKSVSVWSVRDAPGSKDAASVCSEKNFSIWGVCDASGDIDGASVCSENKVSTWSVRDAPGSKDAASVCSERGVSVRSMCGAPGCKEGAPICSDKNSSIGSMPDASGGIDGATFCSDKNISSWRVIDAPQVKEGAHDFSDKNISISNPQGAPDNKDRISTCGDKKVTVWRMQGASGHPGLSTRWVKVFPTEEEMKMAEEISGDTASSIGTDLDILCRSNSLASRIGEGDIGLSVTFDKIYLHSDSSVGGGVKKC